MARKIMLPYRLQEEVIERLRDASRAHRIPVEDVISNALDALEREERVPETVAERLDSLEKRMAEVVEETNTRASKFEQLFAEASANEKERIKALWKILESKMEEHDKAEQERFEMLKRHSL